MSIVLNNLSKSVKIGSQDTITILSNISLVINEGEMVAIQGKSGAGKSTLLHILGLLDPATTGEYILDNIDTSRLTNDKRSTYRNSKFGFVMQDFALINDDTVLDNIILPAVFAKAKIGEVKRKAKDLLNNYGMTGFEERKVGLLSGGEKQRIAIIRSLINNPMYILADEPTGALDSKNAQNIMDIFTDLRNKLNKTIIIVTHDNSVAQKCDKIINIADGKIQ